MGGMSSIASTPQDFATIRANLTLATDDPDLCTEAHYLLWEVCQACNDRDAALAHLDQAIRCDPVRTRQIPDARPQRSVLAIATPGDFQANMPLGMLLPASTLLHVLWLADPDAALAAPHAALPDTLPPFDCVFVTIAEDPRHARALLAADRLAEALGRPTINCGKRIAALSRDGAARLLDGVPDAVVPAQRATDAASLRASPPSFPFIARPRTSHAGYGLARIDNCPSLDAYLDAHPGTDHYVAPFVDFRSSDGYYRKARIVFVGGVPYPVHLAIHDDWQVWYYNAGMARDDWKRAEEARFMTGMAAFVGAAAMRALQLIGRRLGLDYVGLDCAILPDGRLLVFEIETGMIVHDKDPPELFLYKSAPIARIAAALESLIDARIAATAGR